MHYSTPQEYLGAAITLCVEKRGVQVDLQFQQVQVIYDIPMAEVVLDFFDRLKPSVAAMPLSTTVSNVLRRRLCLVGCAD